MGKSARMRATSSSLNGCAGMVMSQALAVVT